MTTMVARMLTKAGCAVYDESEPLSHPLHVHPIDEAQVRTPHKCVEPRSSRTDLMLLECRAEGYKVRTSSYCSARRGRRTELLQDLLNQTPPMYTLLAPAASLGWLVGRSTGPRRHLSLFRG